jgi:hypothetical protein
MTRLVPDHADGQLARGGLSVVAADGALEAPPVAAIRASY